MTPARLVEAVAKEIETAVSTYKLKAEGQEDKKVTVYRQHFNNEDFESDSFYPLVIACWENSEDQEDGSTATIGLTVGVYGEDKNAWMDLASIMERIRQQLLIYRKLDNRFRLIMPTKFETIENQPYPYWFGYATLKYQIGQPSEQMAKDWGRIMEEDNV